MLTRIGALLTLGLAGMFAVLPRADAHGPIAANSDPKSFLLSPEPMSGERFAAFYAILHR
ncbi:MAG: hypothetical protein ABIY37_10050 [Devosia sp.]